MTDVFLTVLRMSLTGSAVILGVLLVRLGLKRAPKIYSYLLWAVVLLRLLTPFGIPMEMPMPDVRLPALFGAETGTEALPGYGEQSFDPEERYDTVDRVNRTNLFPWYTENRPSSEPSVSVPDGRGDFEAAPGTALSETPVMPQPEEPASEEPVIGLFGLNSTQIDRILSAAAAVWIAGCAGMAVWNLVSCALLKRKLREAVPIGGNLRETDRVDTAFVFGLLSPRVYLPAGLGQVEKACVAEHERAHIRRLDPLWRLLSFAALTLHWFNPLVWLAFRLSGKDMEMSCDEAVLKRAPVDIRAAYSKTLVRFASHGRSAGPVLAFGEGETGSRVKNVMKYKKPVLWVSIAAAVVLVLAGTVLAVNLRAKDTSLPFSRYSVDEILFFHDDRRKDILSRMRVEIAGDGSVWTWFEDSEMGWYDAGSIRPLSTDGLNAFVREQTGLKLAAFTDAYRKANMESTGEWLFFTTASGEVYFASVGTELGVMQSVSWLCRLKNEFPEPDETPDGARLEYFSHSLNSAACRGILPLGFSDADGTPYSVFAFLAEPTVKELLSKGYQSDRIPRTFGLAVFKTEGQSEKLVNWALVEEATIPGWRPDAEIPGNAMGPDGGEFTLDLPDGRTLFAEVTLPKTKRSLYGPEGTGSGECPIGFRVDGVPKPADPASQSQPGESAGMTAEEQAREYERQEAERQKEEEQQREESLRQMREQIDAAYDAFLAEHYELEDMTSYLAAYATRRIDLNRDGWNELVVYRMPTESSYPLDIYEYSRIYNTVRAFHTTLEGIPASLNADPSGFWCAQIGAHDPDLADGFYGDFFTFGSETYLISMDGSEWWKKVECHVFTTVSGSLAAQTVFSAERCGPYYFDEAKRNRSFVNGQEIPFDGYFDALTEWRKTWIERTGGDGEALTQTPLWSESELSGWPIVRYPPPDAENGIEQWWSTPDEVPLFRLIYPAGWEQNVTIRPGGAWADDQANPDDPDTPVNPVPLWIDFYDKPEQEKNGIGLLGSLVLYRHAVDRFYPTRHEELMTLTTQDGESYDLVLVYPGDMQYWDYADHYTYWQVRLKSVAARVKTADGNRETIPPERAMHLLHDALVRAYENIWGPFEPLYADPTPEGAVGVEDSLWLRYVTTRLVLSDGRQVGAYEDEDFYYFPIIFPFAVDKRSGAIYKVYEGWDPAAKEGYTQFTPFDPEDPDALAFAG